jgi:hypothetical protein
MLTNGEVAIVKKEQRDLLNTLLDKYERSKTFQGDNKVIQKITVKPEKVFPVYLDDSQYEVFERVNDAIYDLEMRKIINVFRLRNGVVSKIELNLEQLEVGYQVCGRTAKKIIHRQLSEVWERLETAITEKHIAGIFHAYIDEQKERIKQNKEVAYFDGDFGAYCELFQAVYEILKNDTEQFIRDFSVRLFANSKKLELMEDRIRSFLYEYSDCASKDNALEEYGIVKTPTNVSMKGKAILSIGDQILNISEIKGDISFSTISLTQITKIEITGSRVVTVENLTSFHSFEDQDSFIVYLGGYHNSVKRNFLKRLYEGNPEKQYVHFGDIDAGGFYIYEHLIKQSKIPFALLGMDVATLQKHKEAWQELSSNDRKRIQMLLNKEETKGYHEVLQFMLENNCKLEQEAVRI